MNIKTNCKGDLKSKTEVDTLKLQSCKRESSQEQKVTETIRSEKIRPPRPPPPEMNLFTKNLNLKPQTDKLDNLLGDHLKSRILMLGNRVYLRPFNLYWIFNILNFMF